MPAQLRIFVGFDPRQPIAYNVLQYSLFGNASMPLAITPLVLRTLPITRTGLTEFTYTRYLVPWLCNYQGIALFLDADMVVDADIAELFATANGSHGVYVNLDVTPMEWPSAMLFECAKCTRLTPELIEDHRSVPQALASWADDGVGAFDPAWNHCVGYSKRPTANFKPKLIHYTAGIPIWPETRDCAYAQIWHNYHAGLNASCDYNALMRNSVHHKKVVSGEIRGDTTESQNAGR